eukprot:TRINITY_DN39404_c0_g1_i1.p2 TRINITY_DN39404_c0_g1~~TRINITY_DN39404_c0_g1_i1.p2  ORF type:complete len:116 (+),score=12.64 TRINITY_DN39404_c0_g1_i1:41-388(+)
MNNNNNGHGAILSKEEILNSIERGDIVIEPYTEENVGCASIDLTLSNEFRFYKPGLQVLDINEETDYKSITKKVILEEGESYLLLPGCACLSITQEKITLAPNICGLLEGRLVLT